MKDKRFNIRIRASQRLEYGIYQFLDRFLGRARVFRILGGRRKKFYSKLEEDFKKSGEGVAIPVERRKDLSLKEFRKYYMKKGIPVVLEGAAKDWDCAKKWSFQYFKELHGDDEIVVFKPDNENKHEVTTLTKVINDILNGIKTYYRFYPLLMRHPEHLNDFDYQWLRKNKSRLSWIEAFRVFLGSKGTITPLHSENLSNMFVQCYGEKKWVLYPPAYTAIMDPAPIRNAYRVASLKTEKGPLNPFNPDYEFPCTIYKYVNRYETTLKPGDILWNPPFYWHTVINSTDSIGVGYRWFSPSSAFKIAPLYMFLDLFATDPPIWKTFKLSKEDLNLLILSEKRNKGKYTGIRTNQER